MGGVAGEWFRPFARDGRGLGAGEPVHLLHARPDAVGLLGRSAGPRAAASRGHRQVLAALQRLVRPPGRPLRPRHRLGAAPPQVDGGDRGARSFVCALVLQVTCRRLELPAEVRRRHARHRGAHAVERAASSTRAARSRSAAELARTMPETEATNSRVNPSGGRVYVDIGKSTERERSAQEIAARAARHLERWSAPSTSCSTTSTTARRSRCRSTSTAPTRAGCWRSPTTSWTKLRADAGRGRRRPVGAGSAGRAADRARPRPRQLAGHLGERRGAGAARGLRRRRGRRLGRPDRRDRATSRCGCTRTTASTPPTSSTCRSRWRAAT